VSLRQKNIRDQVVPFLALLQTTEGHLGTGDELLGVLQVGELQRRISMAHIEQVLKMLLHTRVFSSQVTPACLLASV
jgi:hypothetical protein